MKRMLKRKIFLAILAGSFLGIMAGGMRVNAAENSKADTVVLDYGLAVALTSEESDNWNIYANDEIEEGYQAAGVEFSTPAYGEIVVQDEIAYYVPTSILKEADTFTYTVTKLTDGENVIDVPEEDREVITVTILPASVMYYEESILATSEDPITVDSDMIQSSDQETEYGYDDVYATATGDSGNSVTLYAKSAENAASNFSFTFKGRGFDVIGTCSDESGRLVYRVTKSDGTVAVYGIVDTYYSVNGDSGIPGTPVIHTMLDSYDEYTVTVYVQASATSKTADDFKLDGIRIYSSLSSMEEYDVSDEDKLQNSAAFLSMHDMLVNTQTGLLNVYEDELTPFGYTVVEDLQKDLNSNSYSSDLMQEYIAKGPAHEVYLGDNAGYAFVATVEDDAYVLSVEARTVPVTDEDTAENDVDVYLVGQSEDEGYDIESLCHPSSVGMYYSIDLSKCIKLSDNKYLVVLTGASDGNNCISLSNLKTANVSISCPYLDDDAMNYISIESGIYKAAIDDAVLVGKSVQRNKTAKFHVYVPEGTELETINAYYSGKLMSNLVVSKEGCDREGYEAYQVNFKAPTTKGKYEITFYANDGDMDSIYSFSTMMVVK